MVNSYMNFFNIILILTNMSFLISCQNEKAEAPQSAYSEVYRNQLHFSPEANWMNDPNGLVYFDGEYHLFYQYYPDSNVWGPMHWGHAVSTDLVTWQHMPVALYPDSLGYIFSGSAVIDHENTSGFGREGGPPPMVAIFTHHEPKGADAGTSTFQYQSLAYSLDKGRSWTKYEGNPVVPNPGIRDFRDPKVIRHNEEWIMVFAANDRVKFYTSPDLRNWTFQSDFGMGHGAQGRPWECPDLFPLVADDGIEKWVLIVSIGSEASNGGSGTQYFIGHWDGERFINDNDPTQVLWLDEGKDNYAGVTWSDIPEADGRRLFIGWMSNWQYAQVVPTTEWRSAMTLPRKLTLNNTKSGYRVLQTPVRELEQLRVQTLQLASGLIEEPLDLLAEISERSGLYELELTFQKPDSFPITITYGDGVGASIATGYNPVTQQFFIDRTFSGHSEFSKEFAGLHQTTRIDEMGDHIFLRIYIDKASIEVFANGGAPVLTDIFFPKTDFSDLEIIPSQGPISLVEGKVHTLKSMW